MQILTYPNDVLRKRCTGPLDDLSDTFLDAMVEAMYLKGGVGLAAPQVGRLLPVFVMDPSGGERSDELEIVIEPSILGVSTLREEGTEGCLSLPGITGTVSRAQQITVQYTHRNGLKVQRVIEGFAARVFQHELDHLSGILYIDHVPTFARKLLLRDYEKLRGS